MSLRARIEAKPETLAEVELAWEQRYTEGLRLLTDEDTRAGGIYLLGYVGEMILKVAYFRFRGAGSDESMNDLLTAKEYIDAVKGSPKDKESNHNLLLWTELLIIARGRSRRLPNPVREELQIYTASLHANWKVSMRYQSVLVEAQEWRDVLEAVTWLYNHHASLWR